MVTYFENQLIKAEAAARTGGDALGYLNEYRAWLATGGRLNATFNDSAGILYDAYVDADFASGGMENSDGVKLVIGTGIIALPNKP